MTGAQNCRRIEKQAAKIWILVSNEDEKCCKGEAYKNGRK